MTTDIPCWQAWCDGTAAPNPGRIGIGVLLVSPAGERREYSLRTGQSGCNNEAELLAVAETIERARQAGARRLHIHSDSRFAVDCLTGLDDTAIPRLARLLAAIREDLARSDTRIVWLPRHRNGDADRLARNALGLASKPPPVQRFRRKGRGKLCETARQRNPLSPLSSPDTRNTED